MKMSRKLLALLLALVMVLSLAACKGKDEETKTPGNDNNTNTQEPAGDKGTDTKEPDSNVTEPEVVKPEKITIMVDGTLVTQENGRDAFEARWEELTGIDLVITQPDHDAYYDVVGQTFAGGDLPDVILLGSTYYAGYAAEGVLWDMTEAWNNSDILASGDVTDTALIDGLYMGGKLYGLTPARGNGCVTYVKQKWLDNVSLKAPTNYAEYVAMLEAFTTGDPDGNGVNGDTYGVSAAGIIGPEAPYVNYLPEFYQDAMPSFYKKADGTWADGFAEPAMKAALERLTDAYSRGLIDKESLTNGTSDCRNKFYEDKFGVFTYWAGTWGTNLKTNLEANGLDGELVALPPIAEVGKYIERQAPVWAITASCENPQGVFDWFFETMMDGGDMQLLFTYGAEGTHWSTKAEEIVGNTYAEGEFHMLENLEKEGTQYTKNHVDPMLAVRTMKNDPGIDRVKPEAKAAADVFYANSRLIELVISTEDMGQYNGDLHSLKKEIIANIVTQGMSYDDEMARYEAEGGAEWSQIIVDSLNAQ